ncbi:MAG: C1 family peptidase [Siphonobacter sp.]
MEEQHAMGWLMDSPDIRDYTITTPKVQALLDQVTDFKPLKASKTAAVTLAPKVDLRSYCSSIEDQGRIGSCTANAGAGLLEYFEKRSTGGYLDASRIFLYKVTRNLLHWTGDTGAYLRSTMKAMATFGVCPEEYCPYSDVTTGTPPPYDAEPTAFMFALASNYKAITYYRLDPPTATPATVLATIKNNLVAGLPCMFGFTVYSSYTTAGSNGGKFPFPKTTESTVGGHAVVAVGYDDNLVIKNPAGGSTTGALLIRNSWGTGWGDGGYGWLPYEYVLQKLATDFWSLIKTDYVSFTTF